MSLLESRYKVSYVLATFPQDSESQAGISDLLIDHILVNKRQQMERYVSLASLV